MWVFSNREFTFLCDYLWQHGYEYMNISLCFSRQTKTGFVIMSNVEGIYDARFACICEGCESFNHAWLSFKENNYATQI